MLQGPGITLLLLLWALGIFGAATCGPALDSPEWLNEHFEGLRRQRDGIDPPDAILDPADGPLEPQ